ncbi:hypothetical protein SAMN05192583_0469 [Sphingomonas gellani]|uniref:Acetaldehyde dehydrogenase n=1 Tax=Sphingomonas gellani TaxID=1166340 RepID=A0A1H7YZA5_9SPHN|nr:DUF779 domain-containing protein [Sphingomonas gellani]SEM51325.1 hypothetical protein SAMN05192583_0469 [Sphingomonas gellani]
MTFAAGVNRVTATPAALDLLAAIVADHGPVLFHQSGGCCDGSSPMCYPRDGFRIGAGDVMLGEVAGQPFYIGARQLAAWGADIRLTLDAVDGRGGMFSLDNGRERRFLIRSPLCSPGEREGPPA